MILQAMNGCLLTQSGEVSIKERRFEKTVTVSSLQEATGWKEIPESEKDKIIAESKLFEPENVDYNYLGKVDSLMDAITDKVNDGGLTAEQALKMKKYFPNWENILGKEVYAGFRFLYDDVLLEVVTPHTLSEDINPAQQPMMLAELPEEENTVIQYYKAVTVEENTNIIND